MPRLLTHCRLSKTLVLMLCALACSVPPLAQAGVAELLLVAATGSGSDPVQKQKKRCPGPRCKCPGPKCNKNQGDGETDSEPAAPDGGTQAGPVNPHEGRNNCLTCAVAVDKREGGDDPKAIASWVGEDKSDDPAVLERHYGRKFQPVSAVLVPEEGSDTITDAQYRKHAKGIAANLNKLFSDLVEPGSRGIVNAERLKGDGHAFNVVHRADGIYIRDAQDVGDGPDGFMARLDSDEAIDYLAGEEFVSAEVIVTHEPAAPRQPPPGL